MTTNAFTPNDQLTLDSSITLRDWQHAARLFVDDQFRLAPKSKFNYHVAFNINKQAILNQELTTYNNEINMLVKNCDLPTFDIKTETLNQYNRKKVVQFHHGFGDLNITFNDDNMGLVNLLWQNYYKYYYADSKAADINGAYNRNAMKNYDYINSTYGLDNGSNNPFFNYIAIYQMARHEYIGYKLINPIITKFNHNKLDYSLSQPHDFSMTLSFESVAYSTGLVSSGDVEGFGITHYDLAPSPLQPNDNSINNVSTSTLSNTYKPDLGSLNTLLTQINNVKNTQNKNVNNNYIITNNSNINSQGLNFPIGIDNTINNIITATKVIL